MWRLQKADPLRILSPGLLEEIVLSFDHQGPDTNTGFLLAAAGNTGLWLDEIITGFLREDSVLFLHLFLHENVSLIPEFIPWS